MPVLVEEVQTLSTVEEKPSLTTEQMKNLCKMQVQVLDEHGPIIGQLKFFSTSTPSNQYGFVVVPGLGDVFIHGQGQVKWGTDGGNDPVLFRADKPPRKDWLILLLDVTENEKGFRANRWLVSNERALRTIQEGIQARPFYRVFDTQDEAHVCVYEGQDLRELRSRYPVEGTISYDSNRLRFETCATLTGEFKACDDPR